MRKELQLLREYMDKNNIDAYIIPSSDAHQGEYVADHFGGRKWLSGFTGSAGTAVVLKEKAGVWTDGRYFIQAETELKDSGLDLFKMATTDPTYEQWLKENLKLGARLAFDGRVISERTFQGLNKELIDKNLTYIIERDAMDEIWDGRPNLPEEIIYDHEVKYAGETREEKVGKIRSYMKENNSQMYVLSSLDDIAWLLNLRGSDVKNTPLFYAYVVVEEANTMLFVDMAKIDEELEEKLNIDGIDLAGYEDIGEYLKDTSSNKKIICDLGKTSRYIYSCLEGEVKDRQDITTKLKACKNEVERSHTREAYLKDCVALAKFFSEIEGNSDVVTEIEAEKLLEDCRREDESFVYNSFDPIVGYGANAAMMHYKATEEKASKIEKSGLLLVDSGGQYTDGTTDITRTVVMGKLTEEEKKDFTLALQGVIDLSTTKFLKGTTGYALDAICRRPLWNVGLDYKCGTGHGVGFFLNIHEGPCGFSQRPGHNNPLQLGNLVTIEPGVYKAGKHGIRHENTIFVTESYKGEFGEFYELETITFFPIDTRAILVDEFSKVQRQWLNDYHRETFEKLSPRLTGKSLEWLKERTKAI